MRGGKLFRVKNYLYVFFISGCVLGGEKVGVDHNPVQFAVRLLLLLLFVERKWELATG